jgi:hypothetical protein
MTDEPFRPGTSPLLRRAAREVAHEWVDSTGGNGAEPSILPALSDLCGLVGESRAQGVLPEATGVGVALRLHLLQRLRAAIVRSGVHGDEDTEERWTLLRACEDTQDGLRAEWSARFGLGLAGPCGVEAAAEVAHGLRSSCSSILFVAEILRDGMFGALNAKQQDQVELLYRVATALSVDLCDLSEIAWGIVRDDERPEARSVAAILDHVRDSLQPLARAQKTDLTIGVSTDRALSEGSRALQRALTNLVLFFLDGAPGGQMRIEVGELGATGMEITITALGSAESSDKWDDAEDDSVFLPGPEGTDLRFSRPVLWLQTARDLVRAMGGELTLGREPFPTAVAVLPTGLSAKAV